MTPEAAAAVQAVTDRADARRRRDHARASAVLPDRVAVDAFVAGLRTGGRITVNFHPDRPDRRGVTVLDGLVADGRYRSQYETGISNGGRSAVPGGDRTGWEAELFGAAYDTDSVPRPVYGALDVTRDPHGGSPRFGSCALVLADHCWDRATFTFGDSHLGPDDVGTWASFLGVASALLEDAADGNGLGRGVTVEDLVQVVAGEARQVSAARELDHYIECQVHGGVSLTDDVTAVLLDAAFRSTAVDDAAVELSARHGVEVVWHGGSVVATGDIPVDFRGPDAHALACSLAGEDGLLTAVDIGRGVAAIPWEPAPTTAGDLPGSPLQLHKQAWHCLLRFGTDVE